jgi:hypothetical protein
MRGDRTRGIPLMMVLAACGDAPRRAAPELFTPVEVASAATANGATPMFSVTPEGAQVLSWVAPSAADALEQLHVEVRHRDGTVRRAVLRDPLGSIEPHGEAPPQVVAGPDGAIHALYTVGRDVGKRFPESALRYSRSDNGGEGWTEPVSVNEGDAFGSHNFHALLAGVDGQVHAAWLSSVRGISGVWIRSSIDGGRTWQAAHPLHEAPTCPCCRTGLATGSQGQLYASWRKIFPGDVRDVVVARSTDRGATWEPPVRPREDNWVFPGCPHAGPSLKSAADGSLHMAWWTGVTGEAGVWYARSDDDGATWSAQPIAIGESSTPAHVQLTIGTAGVVLLAWDDGLGARPTIMLRASRDGGRTFFAAHQLSDSSVAATYPVLGIAGDSVVVAWSQVADEAHRTMLAERPDMDDPNARMPLPRVGQQEVVLRRASLAALIAED